MKLILKIYWTTVLDENIVDFDSKQWSGPNSDSEQEVSDHENSNSPSELNGVDGQEIIQEEEPSQKEKPDWVDHVVENIESVVEGAGEANDVGEENEQQKSPTYGQNVFFYGKIIKIKPAIKWWKNYLLWM